MSKEKNIPRQISKEAIQQLFREYLRDKPPTGSLEVWGGISGVLRFLKVDHKKGFLFSKATASNQLYKKDIFMNPQSQKGVLSFVGYVFSDPLLKIVCILNVALLCLSLGRISRPLIYESLGAFLMMASLVFLVARQQAYHYSELNQMKEMSIGRYVKVLRSEKIQAIPVWQLAFGDIVQIQRGSIIYGGGLLIQGTQVVVDQDEKIGKCGVLVKQTIRKDPLNLEGSTNPFLISGSRVLSGTGKMVALIGDYVPEDSSMDGQVNQASNLKTKFQDQMIRAGTVFTIVLLLTLFLYASSQLSRMAFSQEFPGVTVGFLTESTRQLTSLLCMFMVCVSANSSNSVIASLAQAISQMRENNNLVRDYQAFQNMRCINNICVDRILFKDYQGKIRSDAKEAIEKLRSYSITVILMTEKSRAQALSLSQQAGLLSSKSAYNEQQPNMIQGKEFKQLLLSNTQPKFQQLPVAQARQRLQNLRLFSQATSTQKLDLIWYLTEVCHNNVCVTGVQNSDISAMTKSTVSIALGMSCSSHIVASADIIVLDQKLGSIVRSVELSRNILSSVDRFLEFKYETCISLFLCQAVFYFARNKMLFTSPQLLWIGIIIDVLAIRVSQIGSSLSVPDQIQVTTKSRLRILVLSTYKMVVMIWLMASKYQTRQPGVIFNAFVIITLSSLLAKNIPSERLNSKKMSLMASLVFITITAQTLLVNQGHKMLGTKPISFEQQLRCLALGLGAFIASLLVELIAKLVKVN